MPFTIPIHFNNPNSFLYSSLHTESDTPNSNQHIAPALSPDNILPELAYTFVDLGDLYAHQNKFTDAELMYSEGLNISKKLAENYPESYDNNIPEHLVYSGKYSITEKIEELGIDAGKLVLSPTRTYAPIIKTVLENYRPVIHGMVHCSGGAQTKVMNFIKKLHVIKNNIITCILKIFNY